MSHDIIAQIFESLMMLCFGISWPISIIKTLRTKNPTGKSLIFIMLVIFGYICGIIYKMFGRYDWVVWFYFLNTCSASVDLILCLYYLRKNKRAATKG